jgi:hypothetical protein
VKANPLAAEGHAEECHRQTKWLLLRPWPIRWCGHGWPTLRRRLFRVPNRHRMLSARFKKAEIGKWWPIIKAANIKGE